MFINILFYFLIKVYYNIFNEYSIMKENFMFEQVSKNRRFAYAKMSSQTQEDNSSLKTQKQKFI